jgi:hypothetical protein
MRVSNTRTELATIILSFPNPHDFQPLISNDSAHDK